METRCKMRLREQEGGRSGRAWVLCSEQIRTVLEGLHGHKFNLHPESSRVSSRGVMP